jgi:cathepsin X
MTQCSTCWPANNFACYPVTEYTSHKVSEYGRVREVDNMKQEIFNRGPITCGIDATPELETYNGTGIYSQYHPLDVVEINHIISVAGWGVENGEEYWIVRNSWGTPWGASGWFRLVMGKPEYNLGVESDCSWGVPANA